MMVIRLIDVCNGVVWRGVVWCGVVWWGTCGGIDVLETKLVREGTSREGVGVMRG